MQVGCNIFELKPRLASRILRTKIDKIINANIVNKWTKIDRKKKKIFFNNLWIKMFFSC